LSADGKLAIRNLAGSVHVIGDLTGYFVPHNHDDRYFTKADADERFFEGSTLVLVRADGTAAQNGAALLAAMASISDASGAKPYTIRLAPGTYDVGAGGLDVKPFVDLEGAGRTQTVISAAGSPDLDLSDGGVFGTVRINGRTELRALKVRNLGGASTTAVAIYLQNSNPNARLTSMTVEASGGTGDNMGVLPAVDGQVTDPRMAMNDVDMQVVAGEAIARDNLHHWEMLSVANSRLSVTGGGKVIDALVTNHASSQLTVTDSTLTLDGGGTVLFASSSAASSSLYRNVTIVGNGAGVLGLQIVGGDNPLIHDSTITLTGNLAQGVNVIGTQTLSMLGMRFVLSGGNTIGIGFGITAPTAIVDSSTIQADTVFSSGDPDTIVRVGASKLAGTTLTSGAGTFVCVNSYKSNYTALSATCT
jgi:hypothetical protein